MGEHRRLVGLEPYRAARDVGGGGTGLRNAMCQNVLWTGVPFPSRPYKGELTRIGVIARSDDGSH